MYLQELEDVADADRELHVGGVAHDETGGLSVAGWEAEQFVVSRINVWVVLIGQMSVNHLKSEVLAPLELFEKRDAVENLSIEIPVEAE